MYMEERVTNRDCLVNSDYTCTFFFFFFKAKPAYIPDPSKDYKPRDPLEFIRNIWGKNLIYHYYSKRNILKVLHETLSTL